MVADAEDAVISTDLDGVIATWNHAAERLLGYSVEEAVGARLVLVDEAAAERLRRVRSGSGAPVQGRYRMKGGDTVAVCVTASPVRDEAGAMRGAAMTVRDISARLRREEAAQLQLAELHHGIRNLFALAGSVVSLSARFATSPAELARRVRGRLVALSHASDLRISAGADPAARGDVGLHALVRAIVASHATGDDESGRLRVSGADVVIPGSSVANFALMLDELAGKAVQYGALSQAGGGIAVQTGADAAGLVLQWREHGVALPAGEGLREGAGSRFIRSIATRHLGGAMTRRWEGDGLLVRLVIPRAGLRP